jgi:phage repressor protein C with HTH and peptisase S24 domain
VSETDLPKRLKKVRKSLKSLTQSSFGSAIGMSKASVAGVETGRNKLTYDQLQTIYKVFNVDPLYLLTGEGDIFRQTKYSPTPNTSQIKNTKHKYLIKGTHLVTIEAQAGYSTGEQPQTNLPIVIIPGIQDEDSRVFEVSGDSMEPLLLHGDFIACTKVQEARQLRTGLIYVIVSKDHGISVKYVRLTVNAIRCLSHSPTFEPYNIPLDEVLELWEVQVRITRNLLNTGIATQPINQASTAHVDRVEKAVSKLIDAADKLK